MSGFRWQGLSLTSALGTHWVLREAPESGLWDPQFILGLSSRIPKLSKLVKREVPVKIQID